MTTVDVRWRAASRLGLAGGGLLAVLLFVGVGAVYGGVGLAVNGMGMPQEWLERLPVDSWLWPGVALLLTVALPQLGTAWLVWRRDARAALAGVAAGLALVLWIGVQVLLLQRYFFLQPVMAGLGVLEAVLALLWVRSGPRRDR